MPARSAAIYIAAIKALKVETNPAYAPGEYTYCNVFAQDVMKSSTIDSPLPTGGCEAMRNALANNNFAPWYSVTFQDAQNRANQGYPAIGITIDHCVVVRPNGGTAVTEIGKVQIAQAGKNNYEDTTLSYAWKVADRDAIRFYSYYD